MHFCPWCGASLNPVAADSVDGFVKYTVVFTDGFGFIGIVNNADIRWGKMGIPYFPKYIEPEKYPELFNVTKAELDDLHSDEDVLAYLREKSTIQFDDHINV